MQLSVLWKLEVTDAEDELFSEVADILTPPVVKHKLLQTFEHLHIHRF